MSRTHSSKISQANAFGPMMDGRATPYHARKCAKKKAYPTKAKAMRAKKACQKRFGGSFRAYKCNFCLAWHLTTDTEGRMEYGVKNKANQRRYLADSGKRR